ncbi:MAG: 2-C-methyl-D-erythritol 2,4-cyclodiphosphate synthase, partial [Cyclobacteriaceae bacterium]
DTDEKYKGIDSKVLLKEVHSLITKEGYGIVNIDATISLQKPKVSPYIEHMKECLADVLGISTNDISIKATTTEKLGFVGKEEGVAAQAVVLLYFD